eukprot:c6843_g1_i1.p1 GENE.c6843_g1_i1~~c6843_g1_i1.p1  ORF type:complete len:528 (+),score=119.49 c6843_g1_i1:22-1584(+)
MHDTFGVVGQPPHLVQTVKSILEDKGWLKKPCKVVKLTDCSWDDGRAVDGEHGLLVLGVRMTAAKSLNEFCEKMKKGSVHKDLIGADLADLICGGTVLWLPGLRLPSQPLLVFPSAPSTLTSFSTSAITSSSSTSSSLLPATSPRAVCVPISGAIMPPATSNEFHYIELFAGIGGFRVALEQLGCECTFSCEIDQVTCDCYQLNHNTRPAGDITTIPSSAFPRHHLLTAGFPCQPFTKGGSQPGFNDESRTRGELFFEIIRVLNACQPPSFLLENVPGLLTMEGNTFQTILSELETAGYRVYHRVINSRHCVPQDRERLYFVGIRKDITAEFEWPDTSSECSLTIRDILESDDVVGNRHTLTDHQWRKVQQTAHYKSHPERRIAKLDGAARTLRGNYRHGFAWFSEFVATSASRPRFFTPRECARLQGFPDSFRLPAVESCFYLMVGNAVTPPIIHKIATQILVALGVSIVPPTPCSPPVTAPQQQPQQPQPRQLQQQRSLQQQFIELQQQLSEQQKSFL